MSKIISNEHQIRQIESNPNVASVSDRSIQYIGDFKLRAALENQEGKGPSQIFEEAGFDLTVIGRVKAKTAKTAKNNGMINVEEANKFRDKSL